MVTFTFVHVWNILYVPLYGVSYLYADLIRVVNLFPTLILWSIIVAFSRMMSLYIWFWLLWRIYLHYATWHIGRIVSLPKTSWPGILHLVLWYVERTVKSAAARIPIHGPAPSTYVSCKFYVRTRFPSTWCSIFTIAFACGLPGDTDLVLIPYSFSIKLSLNSWPRNSPPWS